MPVPVRAAFLFHLRSMTSHRGVTTGGTYRIASCEVDVLDSTLVQMTADDGTVSRGKTCPV